MPIRVDGTQGTPAGAGGFVWTARRAATLAVLLVALVLVAVVVGVAVTR